MVGDPGSGGGRLAVRATVAAGCVLFAAAVAVRAIAPASAGVPEDVREDVPRIAEPMQFLAKGGHLRVAELDRWVSEEQREGFRSCRQILFSLEDCPPLLDWIDGPEGQWVEREVTKLRAGTREDAFAALVLLFQVGRACEWSPGILARTQHAERFGGLLQDWLRTRGEEAARDPLLSEPALAAAIAYGRVMRTAWKAPLLTKNEAPYQRATTFLTTLTGIPGGRRTRFGEALAARFSRATEKLLGTNDRLLGFEEEAAVLFPELDGGCP